MDETAEPVSSFFIREIRAIRVHKYISGVIILIIIFSFEKNGACHPDRPRLTINSSIEKLFTSIKISVYYIKHN